MARIRFARVLLFCLLALAARDRVLAQLTKAGSEFQANSYTSSAQRYPAVALDADANFVVAWGSYSQDGSNMGVFARRYDANGVGLASEFQVNSYTSNIQAYPAIARASDGAFVIVWSSFLQDSSNYAVMAQRFDASGTRIATEFQVNTYTLDSQSGSSPPGTNQGPDVAADFDGNFVVVWRSQGQDGSTGGIFAQRFNASGSKVGGEFQVNSYTSGQQQYPVVDVDANGDFVVVWQSLNQDGSTTGVFAQRFSSAGAALGTEFQVNTYTFLSQRYPTVSLENNGDFVVAWESYGQDLSLSGIFAKRFTSSGSAIATEFQVNGVFTGSQRFPTVVADGDGDFTVAWADYGRDGAQYGVFGRRYSSTGTALSVEFQINTHTEFSQSGPQDNPGNSAPAIGIDPAGDFVVAWHSYAQDGNLNGIFAQRYDRIAVLDVDGNGIVAPLTDGLLILRFLFGFTGDALAGSAIDLQGCRRCDGPAVATYLAGLI